VGAGVDGSHGPRSHARARPELEHPLDREPLRCCCDLALELVEARDLSRITSS